MTTGLENSNMKALGACQCAITLREHVATFFTDGGDHGYRHFLALFKDWHKTLKMATQQPEETESKRSSVDEDYFPDEELFTIETGDPRITRHFNEAFAEDLRLEVVYFFLELEELVEGVFNIYDLMKKGQPAMVEAAVVAKLSIDTASTSTSKLQLIYPALKTAEDAAIIVMEHTPKKIMKQMARMVTDFLDKISEPRDFHVGDSDTTEDEVSYEGRFFTYGEERTPQYMYVLPDPSNMIVFLLQQLPLLYNTIHDKTCYCSFMASMDEYFTTRKVTVPIVFTCICWLKSVAALQGKSGLTRNVSLTFKHSKDLMRNLESTVEKGTVLTVDREIHGLLEECVGKIKQSTRGHNLARANPLMASFMMLTHHFHYFHMEYNNHHIRFFDEVLDIYDEMILTPSRSAAVHGSYHRAYLLSSHLTATAVNAMYRGVPSPPGKEGVKVRKVLHFKNLSKIYRLLTENDKSILGDASSKAMLNNAADICSKELFQTRVLSRDILKLNDDRTDVFSEMCDELGQRQYHDDYVARPQRGQSHHRMDHWVPNGYCVVQIGTLSGEGIKIKCKNAAAVIKAKFATPPLVCEKRYFTFRQIQTSSIRSIKASPPPMVLECQDRHRLFDGMMRLFEEKRQAFNWKSNSLRRNRDALFRHQSSLREERLRQSVTAQQDEERRRTLESANNLNVSAAPKKKKNKKKNKKGKKGKTTTNVSASSSVVPDGAAEVSTLLTDLIVPTESEVDTNDDLERVSESIVKNTAATLSRLRDRISLQRTRPTIFNGLWKHSTDRRIRIGIALEALQAIHMMQKFHRINHPAITDPALASWERRRRRQKSQAREILDVLEKRLVKMSFGKRDPMVYREWVFFST
ncbi:LOW QUALITY PROTEIN: hypothetical protein PHPALM_16835 [Phytophthora palmivora]|uniref:Uncharacterized protein n=1 Tax=Phytophthora palmivora TaxID=4796 RepID=A0A2P4XNT3_9STRA|nr:LOW QUALITY PROTEIN: hypothetical protein PHPALM_16835 [Phytophthora palmivora]